MERDDRERCSPRSPEAGRWRGVRQFIESGALPAVVPAKITGGRGQGERCTVCASPIDSTECAFRIPSAGVIVVLDRGCLNLWMASIARGG